LAAVYEEGPSIKTKKTKKGAQRRIGRVQKNDGTKDASLLFKSTTLRHLLGHYFLQLAV